MRLASPRRAAAAILVSGVLVSTVARGAAAPAPGDDKKPKPTVTMKATPLVGFSPARIVVTADVRGGDDAAPDLYCATEEWDWGDDTQSKNTGDCEPFEAGKSSIKRHFTLDHLFEASGDYRVEFRLKQKNKVVARGVTEVKVRPGIRDANDMR